MGDNKPIWLEQVQFVSDALKDKKDRVTGGEYINPNLRPSVNTRPSAQKKNLNMGI